MNAKQLILASALLTLIIAATAFADDPGARVANVMTQDQQSPCIYDTYTCGERLPYKCSYEGGYFCAAQVPGMFENGNSDPCGLLTQHRFNNACSVGQGN